MFRESISPNTLHPTFEEELRALYEQNGNEVVTLSLCRVHEIEPTGAFIAGTQLFSEAGETDEYYDEQKEFTYTLQSSLLGGEFEKLSPHAMFYLMWLRDESGELRPEISLLEINGLRPAPQAHEAQPPAVQAVAALAQRL